MKISYSLIIAVALLFSCSNGNNKDATLSSAMADIPVQIKEIKTGNEADVKTIAELEIEGMTCEIGCAKMIGKTVSDLNGVEKASVDFDADRPVDVAIVTYNPEMINEYEMAAALQKLANGQYKVKKITIKKFIFSKALHEETIEKDQTSMVDVKFSFPNILDIFTLVLR